MPLGKYSYKETNFNSHAHVERDWIKTPEEMFETNFNSHAHVERDILYIFSCTFHIISTHTLTWSVTAGEVNKSNDTRNFNSHAHVERDTSRIRKKNDILHFNSHAHVERDGIPL